ncbi:MAG: lytic transglycosylase [Acidobacteriota bacterium]
MAGAIGRGAGSWMLLAGILAASLACSGQREPRVAADGPQAPATGPAAPPATVEPAPEPAPLESAPELAGAEELAPADAALETDSEPAEVEPAAATLLHESLESFEAAERLRREGATAQALETLDLAYERMAAVDPSGDPVLAQEQENLRILIARRIVEIYAARQVTASDPNGSIPVVINADVEREIRSFQGPERRFFLESYQRSGLYRPMIVAKLREAGLPESLSWLPLVESGFKDRALSSARALGLWQFIASTGYRYGLDRSDWIDERMDPEKSTQAAIGYLSALHALFGDWMTALAGYNCGEHNVLRQIQNQSVSYFDQFWDLYERLPRETRRYVPRFLATLAILEDPDKYGFELPEPFPALAFEPVEIARSAKLEALDKALGLETGTLAKLNPELRRNATPATAYTLKVPPGAGPTVVASLDSLPKYVPPASSAATTTHRVRSGETLSAIASRYRTSVSELMRLNRLRSANRLSIGQRLTVPDRGSSRSTESVASAPAPAVAGAASGDVVRHRVRPGESLWQIASRYRTTIDRLRRDNGISGSFLRTGQVLTVRPGTAG